VAKASFFSAIKSAAGTGSAEIPPECQTVAEGVSYLAKEIPKLGERLYTEDGRTLRPTLSVMLDGRRLKPADFEGAPLKPESQLAFFEVMSGG
jgi:molybdopterin converting factor small subunit